MWGVWNFFSLFPHNFDPQMKMKKRKKAQSQQHQPLLLHMGVNQIPLQHQQEEGALHLEKE